MGPVSSDRRSSHPAGDVVLDIARRFRERKAGDLAGIVRGPLRDEPDRHDTLGVDGRRLVRIDGRIPPGRVQVAVGIIDVEGAQAPEDEGWAAGLGRRQDEGSGGRIGEIIVAAGGVIDIVPAAPRRPALEGQVAGDHGRSRSSSGRPPRTGAHES
jgi:hypothetical protein